METPVLDGMGPHSAEDACSLGHACQFCRFGAQCAIDKPAHERGLIARRLAEIGHFLLVLSNKGGVGKSTVAANVATGLAMRGYRIGVADADIHGPNQSRFFGLVGEQARVSDAGLTPRLFRDAAIDYPIRIASLAFLLARDDQPIVWRDSCKHDFIHHLLGSFDWGPLDVLIVDMPPGTGNELITMCDLLEGAAVAALLVTTPQSVALMDSLKAVRFCRERGIPLLGAVENMSGVVCPHCAGAFHVFPGADLPTALASADVERLARIPLDPALAACSDSGAPLAVSAPECAAAKAFA